MISSKQAGIRSPTRGRSGIISRRLRGRKVIRQLPEKRRKLFLVRTVRLRLVRRPMWLSERRVNHRIQRRRFCISPKRENKLSQKLRRSPNRVKNKFYCISSMILILARSMRRKLQLRQFGCLTLQERFAPKARMRPMCPKIWRVWTISSSKGMTDFKIIIFGTH